MLGLQAATIMRLRISATSKATSRLQTFACVLAGVVAIIALAAPPRAQKQYDSGASDTEIKIGNIMTYTGWAAQYGAIGRAEAAYFRMINENGGVNGRKST
jgi:branched-chain amino acid transport system substrate-binding protein